MYELNVNSRKQLERASLRAQAQKPKIEEIALGMYKVFSTNPATPYNSYSTGIFPAKDGNGYDVVCSCPTQRTVCKHAAAIFPHYMMRLKQFADCEIEVPTFEAQVSEIKDICAATTVALAPAGLVVQGQIATSMQELNNLIQQAIEESDAQEYTEADRAFDTACLFG